MNNRRGKKRPHEGPSQPLSTYNNHYNHKCQRLGRDHVHTTQVQSVHEASATSSGPLLERPASKRRGPDGAMLLLAPKPVGIPQVPQLQQPRPQKSWCGIQKPKDLPPLPPITDSSLETAVFTHPVSLPGHNQNKLEKSYDRLEFLGDAYIELIATRLVYQRYPHMTAGRLSQQRESLVKNESLAAFSVGYEFEKRALLPPRMSHMSPPKSNRRLTDPEKQYVKMLGDVFEAYVAGIVLSNASSGYQIAEEWLHKLWIPKLEAQNSAEVKEPPPHDSKQQLAKRIQSREIRIHYLDAAPPDMSESTSGKTWYTIGAFIKGGKFDGAKLGEGTALSKRTAGMIAATQALSNPLISQVEQIKSEHQQKIAEETMGLQQGAVDVERNAEEGDGASSVDSNDTESSDDSEDS